MHFHVLGLGSVGCLVAHNLRNTLSAKHSVFLVHKTFRRAEKARWVNKIKSETNGLILNAEGFRHEVCEMPEAEYSPALAGHPPSTTANKLRSPTSTGDLPPIQSLIVCLKTYQTIAGIRDLYPRLNSRSTIVLLQNGMGVYEQLIEKFFRDPSTRPNFVLACNTHGAWLKNFMHVVHAGHGEIHLGIVSSGETDFERSDPDLSLDDIAPDPEVDPNHRYASLRSTIQALTSLKPLHVSWRTQEHVHLLMRRKVVVNAIINPLTALLNCHNGELFEHEAAKVIAGKVCREAANAFLAQWEAEMQEHIFAEGATYVSPPHMLGHSQLVDECIRVAYATKENSSSMLSDIKMGKPTEIQSMNGYLVALGKQHGVSMAANKMLLDLINLRSAIPLAHL